MEVNRHRKFQYVLRASRELIYRARRLRIHSTPAEKRLWQFISKKQTGVKFRRQHPISRFIVDFFCIKEKLVIEVDGDYHNKKEQVDYDLARQAHIESFGVRFIRFTNQEVMENIDSCLESIAKTLIKSGE